MALCPPVGHRWFNTYVAAHRVAFLLSLTMIQLHSSVGVIFSPLQYFQGLCVSEIGGCDSFFFIPFRHLAVIFAFMEDFVWCAAPVHNPSSYQDGSHSGLPHLLAEKPRHTSGPSSARGPTSLSDHFFIYLTEKLHLERRGLNKGKKEQKKRLGNEKVGWQVEDQQGKKSIAERFLTKGFFFLPFSLSLSFLSHKLPNIASETWTRQSLPEGESQQY